ncbi:MAG: nitrilase-related carbon-nitrogen hydrolase [Mycobacteriaceae bacterium]
MGVASVGGGTRTGRHAQGGAGKPSSSNKLVVAAAQIAPAAGQIHQNALAVSQYIRAATARGARLVLFPELCLGGYDLALLARQGPGPWKATSGWKQPARHALSRGYTPSSEPRTWPVAEGDCWRP